MDVPIVHKITALYKDLYRLGAKIPKRDKFGIQVKIESVCLETLDIAISAAFAQKQAKEPLLRKLKIKTETLKHLIRLLNELKIIEDKPYLVLQTQLQEISKMATGWLNYVA